MENQTSYRSQFPGLTPSQIFNADGKLAGTFPLLHLQYLTDFMPGMDYKKAKVYTYDSSGSYGIVYSEIKAGSVPCFFYKVRDSSQKLTIHTLTPTIVSTCPIALSMPFKYSDEASTNGIIQQILLVIDHIAPPDLQNFKVDNWR